MNLKEITWQDAESMEPGSKLWVGTREQSTEGIRSNNNWSIVDVMVDDDCWNYTKDEIEATGLKLYIPTPDAVDISPSEAAARMVEGLPVLLSSKGNPPGQGFIDVADPNNFPVGKISDFQWRIPACEPAKQKLTIEVDAGVEVPGAFTIYPNEAGYVVISDNPKGIPAKVIHREAK